VPSGWSHMFQHSPECLLGTLCLVQHGEIAYLAMPVARRMLLAADNRRASSRTSCQEWQAALNIKCSPD
jgi:hypothetical protein